MTPLPQATRRQFLGALGAPLIVSAASFGRDDKVAPSKRITVGVIGSGNMGLGDIRGFLGDPRVQVVAVCDVNKESPGYWAGNVAGREPGRRLVEDHYAEAKKSGSYKGCDTYVDFRDLIGRKAVAVIVVSTPDHWHAIPVIA